MCLKIDKPEYFGCHTSTLLWTCGINDPGYKCLKSYCMFVNGTATLLTVPKMENQEHYYLNLVYDYCSFLWQMIKQFDGIFTQQSKFIFIKWKKRTKPTHCYVSWYLCLLLFLVYTLFAFCEYAVVLSNIGFHMTAYLDFRDKVFVFENIKNEENSPATDSTFKGSWPSVWIRVLCYKHVLIILLFFLPFYFKQLLLK